MWWVAIMRATMTAGTSGGQLITPGAHDVRDGRLLERGRQVAALVGLDRVVIAAPSGWGDPSVASGPLCASCRAAAVVRGTTPGFAPIPDDPAELRTPIRVLPDGRPARA